MAGAVARRRVLYRKQALSLAFLVVVGSTGTAVWIVHGVRFEFASAALVAYLSLVALVTPRGRRLVPSLDDRSQDRLALGWLAARILSPVFEGSVLLPVAWVAQGVSDRVAALALIGFGLAYLATYERAKSEGLGYVGRESSAFLAVRDGILVTGLITGWVEATLWVFAVVVASSVGVRTYNVVHQERIEHAGVRGHRLSRAGR